MKIKKTLALIVTAALTIGTMAGCSQATFNYSKELSDVAKWEATSSNFEGSINIDGFGQKEEISFTASGYATKDQAYVDMKFNNTSGKIKIPELKEYLDGNTVYINKSYYEGIYALNGQPVPEGLSKIKEDYIGIDSAFAGMNIDQIKAITSQPDEMIKLGKLIFGDSGIDIPFVQNGREYTINMNEDEAVDLTTKAIKAAANNLDNISNEFKLGLTPEINDQIKKTVNEQITPLKLNELKTELEGSTFTSKEVFADNSYNADININLKSKSLGNASIALKSSSVKSEVKTIAIPDSKIKLTAEEFSKISASGNTTAVTTTNVLAK